MKQILIAISLFIGVLANCQTLQQNNSYGLIYKATGGSVTTVIPKDTVIRSNDSSYAAIATKAGSGRAYFFDKDFSKRWIELQVVGDTVNNYPTSLAYASDILTMGRNGLSNLTATIPLSLKVNVSDTATMLSTYLRSADTAWLHNKVVSIQSTQDNTVYTNGLLKTGNQVGALYDIAYWNAGKIQGFQVAATAPTDGQVLKWVAANNRYEPGSASGGTETDAIALAALIDTAAAIRADMGSSSTPDLQAVTGVGAITTHNIGVSGVFASLYVYNPSTSAQAVLGINNTTGNGNVSLTTSGGLQGQLAPDILTSNRILLLPDASDTLADRTWVRGLLGGGGGSGDTWATADLTIPSGQTRQHVLEGFSWKVGSGDYINQIDPYSQLEQWQSFLRYKALGTSGDYSGFQVGAGSIVLEYQTSSFAYSAITINSYIDLNSNDVRISILPTYADEAAATAGGLSGGQLYKTSTGELRIKL